MDILNILRVDPKDRVHLRVRDLTVGVRSKRKNDIESDRGSRNILDNISFELGSGELLAVMGGSGTGKTSLLNVLSQRLNLHNKKLEFKGSVEYLQDGGPKKIRYGYLMQRDIFLPGLTLYETLKYQADLRLPPSATSNEKIELIKSLMSILELNHLSDEVICSFGTQETHFSGGERRRVSLAIQLLSNSSILFLDEPTTGLDTSSSLKLMQMLKKLASPEIGITVILSIYQPRREITYLFDKICLLTSGGRIVYYGTFVDSPSYFASLDFARDQIKRAKNAFDSILGLSAKDSTSKLREEKTAERIEKLVAHWRSYSNSTPIILSEKEMQKNFEENVRQFSKSSDEKISFFREVFVLTKRVHLLTLRDKSSLLALNGLALFFGIVSGWLFFKPGLDLAGIRATTSCLYVVLEVIGFCPMYIEIERLWSVDGVCFLREYQENCVSIPGFVLSRKLGKFFLEEVPISIIYSVITYFMFGLRIEGSGSYFLIYWAVTLLVTVNGISAGLLLFAVAPDFAVSSLLTNVFYQLQNSACGFFVNAGTIPVYVRWTKYIAYFWYAFGALCANQYTDWIGSCPYEFGSDSCVQYTGNYQLDILSFPKNWIQEPIGILVAWYFGFNILSAFTLTFKNLESSVAQTKQNKIGDEEEDDDEEEEDEEDTQDDESSMKGIGKESQEIRRQTSLEKVFKSGTNSDITYLQTTTYTDVNYNDNLLNDAARVDSDTTCNDLDISVKDINLSVVPLRFTFRRNGEFEKKLLLDVSSVFKSRTVNAIMGPSGSGKTTFLNFLANRLAFKYKSTGAIYLNGSHQILNSQLAKLSAYVTQHDNALMPRLTVRETLYFQARLRLPLEDHNKIPLIVNTMLRKTELVDCADTLVGSEYIKGISNGNRRRLSIGIQLLSKPRILFLDEPTSGLDTRSAGALLTLLNNLSKEGRTIILTIHQPSEAIFSQFGMLLLFAKGGRVMYSGVASYLKDYFNSIGLDVPEDKNIADYALDLMSPGINDDDDMVAKRVESIVSSWSVRSPTIEFHDSKDAIDLGALEKKSLPSSYTLTAIVKRQFVNSVRTKDALISRAGQTIFQAVVIALYFAPLRNSNDGVNNRLGLIQEVMNLYYVGLVNNISLYPIERNLFYQEYEDGLYGVLEFSASYLLLELPTEIIPSLIFAVFIVFACGLPRNASMYFSMFLSGLALINCGESLGIVVNSVFSHLGIALNVLSSLVIVAIFMGGTMSINMPSFFYGINYINPAKYAVGICSRLGFKNQDFDCGSVECTLDTGKKVLEYYNLNIDLGSYFGGLIACLIAYRAVAILTLYIRVRYYN